MPSLTGSVQARAPGAPSTETMQLGHWPAQHSRPRRRWYLKLREKVLRPAAKSAEPIVSPSYPSTGLPSNVKRTTRSRAIRSPGWTGRRVMAWPPPLAESPRPQIRVAPCSGRLDLIRPSREQHLVGVRVPLGDEPRPAARTVKPPLPLYPRDVAPEVVVRVQLAEGRPGSRPRHHLATEAKVRHLSRAAIWTAK